MKNIVYSHTDESALDSVGPLWQKLNEYHRERSPYFGHHFSRMTFERRKQWLLEKTKNGKVRVDLAADTDTGETVGFCISTVSEGIPGEIHGEIDTLFIEEGYRRSGIGDAFMKRALEWLDSMSAKMKRIMVAVGNEEVFAFYRRYGFVPWIVTLMQMDDSNLEPEN